MPDERPQVAEQPVAPETAPVQRAERRFLSRFEVRGRLLMLSLVRTRSGRPYVLLVAHPSREDGPHPPIDVWLAMHELDGWLRRLTEARDALAAELAGEGVPKR